MGNCSSNRNFFRGRKSKRKDEPSPDEPVEPADSPVEMAIKKSLSFDSVASDSSVSLSSRRKRAAPSHRVLYIILAGVAGRRNWMHVPKGGAAIGLWWQFEADAREKDKMPGLDRALVTALVLRARAISLGYVVVIHMPFDVTPRGMVTMAENVCDDCARLPDAIEAVAMIEIRAADGARRMRQIEPQAALSAFAIHPLTEIDGRKIYLETPADRGACSFDSLVTDTVVFLDGLDDGEERANSNKKCT